MVPGTLSLGDRGIVPVSVSRPPQVAVSTVGLRSSLCYCCLVGVVCIPSKIFNIAYWPRLRFEVELCLESSMLGLEEAAMGVLVVVPTQKYPELSHRPVMSLPSRCGATITHQLNVYLRKSLLFRADPFCCG
jgi:hypothetical protein